MTTRLFELSFDVDAHPWYLGDPEPSVFSPSFAAGERLDIVDAPRFPVAQDGRRVDVTFSGGRVIVVRRSVAALIDRLAPGDVQRIAVEVIGEDERYELLHVLSRIDAVDWERTPARARPEGSTNSIGGTLASLGPLIDRSRLHRHVMSDDVIMDAMGIDGPRIFRVIGWDLFPTVTEPLKDTLEEREISGIAFRQLRTSPRDP